MAESSNRSANNRSAMWVWLIFAIIFIIMGVTIAIAAPAPGVQNAASLFQLGATFGFLFGAVSALATWTALERTRYRIAISLLLNFAIATLFSVFVLRTGGPWSVVAMAWATLLFLNLVIQGPLWFLRLKSGYEFRSVDQDDPAEQNHPQFSIGNMLVLTTVIAILIAAAKQLVPLIEENASNSGNFELKWIFLFLFFSLGAVTTTLGSLWFMSTRKMIPLLLASILWLGLNAVSLYHMQSMIPNSFLQSCCFSITCNVVSAAMVCIPLWILDIRGRRLAFVSQ